MKLTLGFRAGRGIDATTSSAGAAGLRSVDSHCFMHVMKVGGIAQRGRIKLRDNLAFPSG